MFGGEAAQAANSRHIADYSAYLRPGAPRRSDGHPQVFLDVRGTVVTAALTFLFEAHLSSERNMSAHAWRMDARKIGRFLCGAKE